MSQDKTARGQIVALKEVLAERDRRYTERFDAQEGANRLALDAAEKAVLKAENAAERRFEAVNEFRQTLSDQARDFIPRKEVEALFESMKADIRRLEGQDNVRAGRGIGMGQLWGFIIGGAGVAIALAATIWPR